MLKEIKFPRCLYILSCFLLFFAFIFLITYNIKKTERNLAYGLPNSQNRDYISLTNKNSWTKNGITSTKLLTAKSKVTESFTAKEDNLSSIAIFFNTYNRINSGHLIFRIKEKNNKSWYFQSEYNTDQFQNGTPFVFQVPVISNSKNNTYTFDLESIDGKKGDAVSLSSNTQYFLAKFKLTKSDLKDPRQLFEFLLNKLVEQILLLSIYEIIALLMIVASPFLLYRVIKDDSEQTRKDLQINSRGREKWIDVTKGIAIIAVVVGHTIAQTENLPKIIYSFHMPLFFIISGYLFNFNKYKNNFGKLFFYKFNRLMVPVFITGLIIYILLVFMQLFSFDMLIKVFDRTAKQYLLGAETVFPLTNKVEVVWFLQCLFLAELFFYGLINLMSRADNSSRWFIVSVISICGYLMGKNYPLALSIDIALVAQPFLFAGYKMRQSRLLDKKLSFPILTGIILLWGIHLKIDRIDMNNRLYGLFILFVLGSIAASWLIMYVIKNIPNIRNKVFSFVFDLFAYTGKYSLVILCFHYLDVIANWDSVPGLNFLYDNRFLLLFFRILFSIICIEIIRRTPVLRECYQVTKNKNIKTKIKSTLVTIERQRVLR